MDLGELSELEFGLDLGRQRVSPLDGTCNRGGGYLELGPLDVLVLHSVYHCERPKKLADICLVLNIEDTHTVNYSVKKLIKAGLVKDGRQGKEKTIIATEQGAKTW